MRATYDAPNDAIECVLGDTNDGFITIEVPRLIESRLLVQANSGSGKSWALRRILEQTHHRVQQVVLDVEDEFHTLRERGDYILAGRASGGDCPAEPRSAPLLARRLLELGVSAIISLYELHERDRHLFVQKFLESMMNAPRDLWHPVLVVIDEAHKFCPQVGSSVAAGAVIDLMTRGRKRGFCGVLATQRISKLHKDAAAEANNKLIGRSALDVDMKRAAEELGLAGKAEVASLRQMKPGHFYAFGPALSDTVRAVKVGDVATTHPRAGERSAAVPPAPAKVRAILAQLADLPAEAEEEERTVEQLRADLASLRRDLETERAERAKEALRARTQPNGFSIAERERVQPVLERLRNIPAELAVVAADLDKALAAVVPTIGAVLARAQQRDEGATPATWSGMPASVVISDIKALSSREVAEIVSTSHGDGKGIVPRGGAAHTVLLPPLVRFGALSRDDLAILSGIARGGTFDKYLSTCRSEGLVDSAPGATMIAATGKGRVANQGREPLDYTLRLALWMRKAGSARELLDALVVAWPKSLTRDELAARAGYSRGGTFDKYLSTVKGLGVVLVDRQVVSLAPAFMHGRKGE